MSIADLRIIVSIRLIRKLRLAGVLLFLLALLLPVFRDSLGQSYSGWQCAWIVTGLTNASQISLASEYLIVGINLLIVAGFLLGFSRRFRTVQMLLVAVLLLVIPAGGLFLFLDRITPLAGIFLWVGAALFLVLPVPFLVPARYAERTAEPVPSHQRQISSTRS